MEVWDAVCASNDDHLRHKVEKSLDIIERTLDLYRCVGCMRYVHVCLTFNASACCLFAAQGPLLSVLMEAKTLQCYYTSSAQQ